jgi:hypothetical protein
MLHVVEKKLPGKEHNVIFLEQLKHYVLQIRKSFMGVFDKTIQLIFVS